jgi:alginate O-acetyltransferase complex protein AlgI
MSLLNILIMIGFSLGVAGLCLFPGGRKLRNPILLVASVFAIFWLQPVLPIRGIDFWLPTATLFIAAGGWLLTAQSQEQNYRQTLKTGSLILLTVLVIALTRLLSSSGIVTPSRPPQTIEVVIVLAILGVLLFFARWVKRVSPAWLTIGIVFVLALFVVLKLPMLTQLVSEGLRGLTGQSVNLASALDLRWLGFSYVAFRLIHTLRERQNGRLPSMRLEAFFIYTLFFPAFTAGPIERSERFLRDLQQPYLPGAEQMGQGAKRLLTGLFKKFALADSLALIALSAVNAGQVQSAGWTWLLVYAYTFQIFFDFSGYTDIALGMAQWMGFRLPENFNAPYLKPNLTQFWNSWHMSLTQWFRTYFFNPLTRSIRSNAKQIPVWTVILITQLSTMVLIGLWHGITLNFVLWGCWHGLGLFIHNRWSEWMKPLAPRLQAKPGLQRVLKVFSTVLTFQFVALGWVWFALPTVSDSWRVFLQLFGAAG